MTSPVWAADGSDGAVAARVAATIARPGPKTLVMPGGSTPRPIFARLAAMPLRWDEVTLLPGDDRAVGPTHLASNLGQLHRAFGATAASIVPLVAGMPLPHCDLIWLGVGDDGHVASLFPGNDPNPYAPPLVIAVTPDPLPADAPFPRLTLTLAALTQADVVIIVARGAAKRRVLDAALAGADLPVTRLFALSRTPVTLYWSEA